MTLVDQADGANQTVAYQTIQVDHVPPYLNDIDGVSLRDPVDHVALVNSMTLTGLFTDLGLKMHSRYKSIGATVKSHAAS